MIPTTSILDNGDDTIWVVCPNEYTEENDQNWFHLAFWHGSNHPCITCNGTGDGPWDHTCQVCNGTGRHVFEILTDRVLSNGSERFTVYVAPYMILRIHDWTESLEEHINPNCIWWWGNRPLLGGNFITLPPDAKPGMWAILLEVIK